MDTHTKDNNGQKRKPKIGVVIGAGGLKPAAAVELVSFLDEEGIEVDLVVACSGGSIVAGLWGMGWDAQMMREGYVEAWTRDLFTQIDYRTLLSVANLPFGKYNIDRGLIKPDNIHKAFVKLFGDARLENSNKKTILQATDLFSGENVLLEEGTVKDTVHSSISLFPFMPAYNMEGRWLIDGAYSSPLPILEAVKREMDIIIAFTYEERTTQRSRGFFPYFMRAVGYSQDWIQRNQAALSVLYHHNEIIFINTVFDRFISLKSVRRIPHIFEKGKEAVETVKGEIIAAIENFEKKQEAS